MDPAYVLVLMNPDAADGPPSQAAREDPFPLPKEELVIPADKF
jgi:hypothetical protein